MLALGLQRFNRFILLVLLFAALPIISQAQQTVTGYVNAGALNVRSAPHAINSQPVTVIYEWTNVLLIGRNSDLTWYEVQLATGVIGWVRSTYITVTQGNVANLPVSDSPCTTFPCPNEPAPNPVVNPPRYGGNSVQGYVNVSALNVRQSPNDYGNILAVIYQGTNVTLVGRNTSATWYEVQFGYGRSGWVNASYIAVTQGDIWALPITDTNVTPCNPVTCPPTSTVTAYVNTGALNVRSVPNFYGNYPIAIIYRNTVVTVIGRNQDNTWWKVRLSNGTIGWSRSTYLNISSGTIGTVPITS